MRFDDTTKCILCAACTTSCPIFWANSSYVGPMAIVQAHRFIFDDRDRGGQLRLSILADANGVWRNKGELALDTTYKIVASATNADGVATESTRTFSTNAGLSSG